MYKRQGRILRTTPLNLHEWSVVVLFGLSIIVVDLLDVYKRQELWYSKKAFRSGSIWGFLPHGSGIIIITACGRLRPDMTRNSRQLSKDVYKRQQ